MKKFMKLALKAGIYAAIIKTIYTAGRVDGATEVFKANPGLLPDTELKLTRKYTLVLTDELINTTGEEEEVEVDD